MNTIYNYTVIVDEIQADKDGMPREMLTDYAVMKLNEKLENDEDYRHMRLINIESQYGWRSIPDIKCIRLTAWVEIPPE